MKKQDGVMVLFALLLPACSSVPQTLDPNKFYKRDLPVCAGTTSCFEGAVVLPALSSYELDVAPKGNASIDLLIATTCHREDSFEKTAKGWFIFQSKARFKYFYTPVSGIEDDGSCDLVLNTFEKDKGRHAWARIRFEHAKFKLPATLSCNGVTSRVGGVSICQSKAGLAQHIKFDEAVMFEWDKNCAAPKKAADGSYEFAISLGECGYTVRNRAGDLHDLLTVGYEGILVRNEQ